MQPRPRFPMQGGGMPPQFRGPMQARPNIGPMMGPMQQTRQGGGGLLAKLLGKGGNPASAAGGLNSMRAAAPGAANAAGSGGFLKSIANPSSISGFLSNTQKMLNTAQQFGPMVQQYGPMVKNLPAMWKLYRGLKSSGNEESEKEAASETKKAPSPPEKRETETAGFPQPSEAPKRAKAPGKGSSSPKLYI
ncbi:YqfQ family protein [Bacillus infantis]|uniref:YqfQ-like protein n=1 Tax=Bacillus infantis TaxID=324767 RepID=A0A5D4QYS8_9BACI|nr:YqfQ family protein [Bacillus infantis]TYS44293.1 hypothetical protein FZD51_20685 [Bacillus infantis]